MHGIERGIGIVSLTVDISHYGFHPYKSLIVQHHLRRDCYTETE